MGFALVIIGLLMVLTGAKGTYAQFGQQVASEFQGPQSFTYWFLALGIVGAVGYVDALRSISRLLMTLILLSIFLANRGFFDKFQQALQQGPVPPKPTATAGIPPVYDVPGGPGGAQTGDDFAKAKAAKEKEANQTGGISFWDFIGKFNPFATTPAF